MTTRLRNKVTIDGVPRYIAYMSEINEVVRPPRLYDVGLRGIQG
jgi:hypothetical protein